MSAFGSYGGVQEISFTHRKQGLFLIAGDTGSGKSTIFDGIMFALFNTMSGKERKGGMMRSEYAADTEKTWVEFTFSYRSPDGEQCYTEYRSPAYQRRSRHKNKQGEYGYTKQNGQVRLIMPDGREYPGKAVEINRKIEEIIGLTSEQFSRMAMIAQGEFQELIMDKTGKRKEIFQEIFSTQLYGEIEKAIWERFRQEYGKQKDNALLLEGVLDRVQPLETSEYLDVWEDAKRKYDTEPELVQQVLESVLQEIRTACRQQEEICLRCQQESDRTKLKLQQLTERNEAWSRYEQEQNIRQQLLEQQQEYEQKREQAKLGIRIARTLELEKEYRQASAKWENWQSRSRQLEEEVHKAGQEDKAKQEGYRLFLERYSSEQKETAQQSAILEKELVEYQRRECLLREWEDACKKAENSEKELARHFQEREELQQEQIRLKEEVKQAPDNSLRLQELGQSIRQNQERRENLRKLQQEGRKLDERQKRLEELQKLWIEQTEVWERLRRETEQLNRKYIQGQAGLLARSLKEGEACPVCGSTVHPEPCIVQENELVSPEQLEEASLREKKAQEEAEDRKELAVQAREEVQTARALLEQSAAVYLPDREWEDVKNELTDILDRTEQEQEKLAAQQDACETVRIKLERSQKRLEETEALLRNLEQPIQKLEEALRDARLQRDVRAKELEHLNSRLRYASLKEAEAALAESEKRRRELERQKAEAEEDSKKSTKALESARGRQKEHLDGGDGIRRQAEDSYEAFRQSLSEQGFLAGEEWTLYEQEQYRQAAACSQKVEALQEEWEKYQESCSRNQAKIEELKQQIQERPREDDTILRQQLESLQEELKTAGRKKEELVYLRQKNQTELQNWNKMRREREGGRKRLATIKSLNDAANGKKIHFQTYVQRQYFKQIIQAANRRLSKMNQNQFLLKCRDIQEGGQGEAGLDLDVINPLTGKVRDAHTLSGGETFLASLAMALGLADIVQSRVGGTRLETMFIDEGFGSLSPEVRNTAVQVLLELAGTDRLIGVISHVTELKEQIPDKLIVTKDSRGSHAKWELD